MLAKERSIQRTSGPVCWDHQHNCVAAASTHKGRRRYQELTSSPGSATLRKQPKNPPPTDFGVLPWDASHIHSATFCDELTG